MTEKELKKWIKNNLELTVVEANNYEPENSVYVSLAFRDEVDPFCSAYIFIPEAK